MYVPLFMRTILGGTDDNDPKKQRLRSITSCLGNCYFLDYSNFWIAGSI